MAVTTCALQTECCDAHVTIVSWNLRLTLVLQHVLCAYEHRLESPFGRAQQSR